MKLLLAVPDYFRIEQENPAGPLSSKYESHRRDRLELFHACQAGEKTRVHVADAHPGAVEQHGVVALGAALRVQRVHRRVEQVRRLVLRGRFAPAQGGGAFRVAIDLRQKHAVAVHFPGSADHAARAVDVQDLAQDLFQRRRQSCLHPGRAQHPRNHRALGPQLFLILRHVSQEQAQHHQVHRSQEELLRIQLPHPQLRQVDRPQIRVGSLLEALVHPERFGPQQEHRGDRRTHCLPKSPAIRRRCHHEHEKQKKWSPLGGGKQRHQHRPHNVGAMHNQAKGAGGLAPDAHQQHHHHGVHQVDRQQPEQPAGIDHAARRFHPKRDQGGSGERHPSRGQPAFRAPDLAGTEGRPEAPQVTVMRSKPRHGTSFYGQQPRVPNLESSLYPCWCLGTEPRSPGPYSELPPRGSRRPPRSGSENVFCWLLW